MVDAWAASEFAQARRREEELAEARDIAQRREQSAEITAAEGRQRADMERHERMEELAEMQEVVDRAAEAIVAVHMREDVNKRPEKSARASVARSAQRD